MQFDAMTRRTLSLLAILAMWPSCFADDPSKESKAKLSTSDPLKALGTSLKLPEIGEAGTAMKVNVLAKTEVSAEAVVLIDLLGCKSAAQERGILWELTAESPDAANRRWRFEMRRSPQAEPTTLANLSLTDGAIRFQWTEAAANEPQAGTLANCALKIAAGKALKTTALRQPTPAKAWQLSLEEEISTSFEIDNAPPRSSMKVEMSLTIPKETARYRFIGSSAIAPGEATSLELMGRRASGALRIRIEAEWKRDRLELTAIPQLLVSEKKTIKLTPNAIKREREQCDEAQAKLKAQESAITKQVAAAKKGKAKFDSTAADRVLAQLRAELKTLAALDSRLTEAAELMDDKKLKLPLTVSVIHQSDEASIMLVAPGK